MLKDLDLLSLGYTCMAGTAGMVILGVAKSAFNVSFNWFRPGQWIVGLFQIQAMYATCFYRGLDAFVVYWRETKQELKEEILECEK